MMDRIESGILARLQAASDAGVLGYEYKTLATYPVDWDAYISEVGAGLPAPAAWATFAGWRPLDREDQGSSSIIATFGLVVMAQNLRVEEATRHGGPNQDKEPGSYLMAMHAAALLQGQDFDLPIGSIKIGGLRFVQRLPAWKDRKVSMLALELITGFSIEALSVDGDLPDFALFHANWDTPPFGGVDADAEADGVQLPADEEADATDHVELEIVAP